MDHRLSKPDTDSWVDERMARMRSFRRQLATYLAECEHTLAREGEGVDCPVVDEIAHRPLVTGALPEYHQPQTPDRGPVVSPSHRARPRPSRPGRSNLRPSNRMGIAHLSS